MNVCDGDGVVTSDAVPVPNVVAAPGTVSSDTVAVLLCLASPSHTVMFFPLFTTVMHTHKCDPPCPPPAPPVVFYVIGHINYYYQS